MDSAGPQEDDSQTFLALFDEEMEAEIRKMVPPNGKLASKIDIAPSSKFIPKEDLLDQLGALITTAHQRL
jgi:hypothetical protein